VSKPGQGWAEANRNKPRRTAFVHLKHGLDVARYREQYRRGEVPDETPYGFHHAESMGWEVQFSEDHEESSLVRFVRRALLRVLGFDLVHAFRNRRAIAGADIVWTMEEIQFLAVCALPWVAWGMRRPRLIAQTVWLWNRWEQYSGLRRAMLRRLLRRADALTFHSERYLPVVERWLPGSQPRLLPFGISLDSFPWTEARARTHHPLRVLSMGSDPTRDWTTLLRACGNDERFEMGVVCGWLDEATAGRYSNLRVPRNPSMQEFRELYAWADVVVVPMVPNLYSGITVALEATSLGLPVVCSDTGGVPTYFSPDEVVYVPAADAEALRAALLGTTPEQRSGWAQRAQRRFQREDYSTRGVARRYVALSEELLEPSGADGKPGGA
jgi:glycosyltransferase involved in cell wall biosynthesis